ncbi:GNAT family N-acetyltransferase [Nocardia sp. CDC160]|uniref:GNAT family N-acetyltransferase n=1 Tax=Nocardia sp. CDC160 TaxID=3112166 RepID=UPI002DBF0F0E|nr:GNAT family N-acetyltransferase [Nocardia sp. CDC160]MEC3915532.1 GNAT family N-acetyltransferase [Nocardia sp. CDC160]
MIVTPLQTDHIDDVIQLMQLGKPSISARTRSDYWLYASLFSSTCPLAIGEGDAIAGAIIAFRSQDDPADVYVQDVMIHPDYRRQGIARALLNSVQSRAEKWSCQRIYLTSEPENHTAHSAWTNLGFVNVPGDHEIEGISVITDFKGPGRSRAVYELLLPRS